MDGNTAQIEQIHPKEQKEHQMGYGQIFARQSKRL
jgi:hypothetical protein